MTTGSPPDLRGAVVLVIGDIMLDEYLWGDVTRVSPEAPVPIVEIAHRTVAPGGAGNAAAAVAALGGRALLAGVVGEDVGGTRLRGALDDAGVDAGGVLVDPARVTTTKSRLIARGQHVVRTDSEDRSPLPAELDERLRRFAEVTVGGVDAVVLSDYSKGVLSPALARAAIDLARGCGKPVIVDPTGTDYLRYRGATMITPGVGEVELAVHRQVSTPEDLVAAGVELVGLLPGTDVLVTRGAGGMWLMSGTGVALDIPTQARSVYDVTGAGDTVVATLAVALGRGTAREDAIRLANAAAGIAVGKVGTARVSLAELGNVVAGGHPGSAAIGIGTV